VKCLMLLFIFIIGPPIANAQIKVVTSTQTLAALVKSLGAEDVQVEYLSRGTEDPHYVEAKPSFMVKVRDADLVVIVGLDLEKSWMDSVVKGSRNPKVLPGAKGHFGLRRLYLID
jgi:zinc/manganese transport system substrate-binding protein